METMISTAVVATALAQELENALAMCREPGSIALTQTVQTLASGSILAIEELNRRLLGATDEASRIQTLIDESWVAKAATERRTGSMGGA